MLNAEEDGEQSDDGDVMQVDSQDSDYEDLKRIQQQ